MVNLKSMSFMQSIYISLTGLSLVFLALIALALAILIVSKILNAINLGEDNKKTGTTSVKENIDNKDEELIAVIIGAVSKEVNLKPNEFKITSIKEK